MDNLISEIADGLWENFPAVVSLFLFGLLLIYSNLLLLHLRMQLQKTEEKLKQEQLKSKQLQDEVVYWKSKTIL